MILKLKNLADTHAHLNSESFDSIDEIAKRSKSNGVELILDVGIDLESSKKSIELSKKYPGTIKSFVGIDPDIFIPNPENFKGLDYSYKDLEEMVYELRGILNGNLDFIVGIGEVGVDNYWINSDKTLSVLEKDKSIDLQTRLFELQIELACEFSLPLTIHSRGYENEVLKILGTKARGVFHSYTADYKTAVKILDSGNALGVNGIVTFKNASELRDVYKKIIGKVRAKDMSPEFFYRKGIYFETDTPFLAPIGKRGEHNEPANIKIIYDFFVEMLSS